MAKATCSVEGCERPRDARGWCSSHYMSWWRYGDPEKRIRTRHTGSPQERFWLRVDKNAPNGCWLWTGAKMHGYGRFNVGGGKIVGAHQFAYEQLIGPVPKGLELDHLCRNPSCVNPQHLEPVTHQTNIVRGDAPAVLRALYASMTHCRRGHPWDEANTYWWRGKRHCRACQRLRKQARSRP